MESIKIIQGNVYDEGCPTRLVLDRIADKWTVLIVGRLAGGKYRFGALQREIAGISPKILTQKLRELERDGIVTRRVYASVPPKVEYNLTALGQTLVGLLGEITRWSETHIEAVLEAQRSFDQRRTGEEELEQVST
jgi:DNA-binding HxlR family transcriptional regulator